MQEGVIAVIVLVGETIITTIVGLIIGTWGNKKQKEKEELNKLREEKRIEEDNVRCQRMKDAVHEEMLDMKDELKKEIDPLRVDLDLMKKTMQKDTRRSLRQDAAKYIKRGGATPQEKTEYDELYWCYHNLGRNGVIDKDHEDVMNLPNEAPKGDDK